MQPKEYGIVFFDSQPHGARIYVDGQLLINPDTEESIKTPAKALLIEGRRNFIFVLEGHKDLSGYVDVLAGVTVNIFKNMEPGTSKEGWGEPEPQIFLTELNTGIIRIYSSPDGADVYINRRYMGKAPLIVTDVPAGIATVKWKMTGMMEEEKIVDIVEGAWSDTYSTMRPVLPKLQSYYQNDVKINNDTANMNIMQEPFFPQSPEIPCAFPEKPGETATQGSIVITTYPFGGTIIMDGKTVIDLDTGEPLRTPIQLVMTMGYHDFIFQLEGFFDEYGGEYITPGHISYVHRNFNVR
jgi:hypothetical protein